MSYGSAKRGTRRYAIAIVVTMAIGIAVATALLPVLHSAFLSEGWLGGAGIVSIMTEDPRLGVRTSVGVDTLASWRDTLQCCAPLEGLAIADSVMRLESGARRVRAALVGHRFFELAEIQTLAGRVLTEDDSSSAVALVTRRMARAHLGGVRDAVGKQIVLDGESVVVAGVVQDDFLRALHLADAVDVARPLDPSKSPGLLVFARLQEDVSPRQAQAELDTWASAQPGGADGQKWVVLSSSERLDTHTRKMLELALLGGLTLLVVTGVNVSHLLAARNAERRKDVATRWALGANRRAQLRWQTREVALWALLSGVAAAALAEGGLRSLSAVVPEDLRMLLGAGLDATAFAFALGLAFMMLLCCGVLPNLFRGATALQADLATDQRLGRRPGWRARLAGLHVVTLAAAAFVLAVVAQLLFGSVLKLSRLDFGFEARGLHTVHLSRAQEPAGDSVEGFSKTYAEALSALPGVESLAVASQPPPASGIYLGEIRFGSRDGQGTVLMGAAMTAVGPGYFRTVRQKILAGREFLPEDVRSSAPVLVVSETAARHLASEPRGALDRDVWLGGQRKRVVGVVQDTHAPDFLRPFGRLQLYRPMGEPGRDATFLVRSSLPVGRAAQDFASHLDPDAVVETSSVEELYWESLATIRSLSVLLSVLLAVVVVLAVTGVYGMFSGFAARQRGQIAVRMMLGARREEVRRRMLLQGLRLSLAGILAGLLASYPVSRLVEAQLYGLAPDSAPARLGAALLVLSASLVAVWLPAVRSARVDPGEVLRLA